MKFRAFFLLVLFSAAANASAVFWNSGNGISSPKFLDPNGNKLSPELNYCINVYFYDSDSAMEPVLKSTTTLTAGTGSFQKTTDNIFSQSKTYYVKAIVENDSYIRSTDLLSFTTPGENADVNINFASGIGLTNPSGGSATWGDWTEKGGDVPEPTTCSLLLVGLAGMGLKKLRKRNKKA